MSKSILFFSVLFFKYEFYSLSDLSLCSKRNEINCGENWDTKDCGQLEHAKFKNYGCTYGTNYAHDYFECSNRMDQKEHLFGRPPVLKNYGGASNLNDILNFDNTTIYCGQLNITYEDLFDVNAEHGNEFCKLTDGSDIRIQDVLIYVWFDFSFMMTEKINDL